MRQLYKDNFLYVNKYTFVSSKRTPGNSSRAFFVLPRHCFCRTVEFEPVVRERLLFALAGITLLSRDLLLPEPEFVSTPGLVLLSPKAPREAFSFANE